MGLRVYLELLLVACSCCTILVWNWLLSHCGLAVMQTCALRGLSVVFLFFQTPNSSAKCGLAFQRRSDRTPPLIWPISICQVSFMSVRSVVMSGYLASLSAAPRPNCTPSSRKLKFSSIRSSNQSFRTSNIHIWMKNRARVQERRKLGGVVAERPAQPCPCAAGLL